MRDRLHAIGAAIGSVVGIEEVAIYTALGLIAWGCWQVWPPAAGIVPGVVMLWMYLPPRRPFFTERAPSVAVHRKDK